VLRIRSVIAVGRFMVVVLHQHLMPVICAPPQSTHLTGKIPSHDLLIDESQLKQLFLLAVKCIAILFRFILIKLYTMSDLPFYYNETQG
jgi:hypothetical protein